MKMSLYLGLLLVCLGSFAASASAQKTTKPVRRPPAVVVTKPFIGPDVKAAKEKVSNQLSNVNNFVNVLGPVAVSIENLDKEAKTKKVPKAKLDANEANKQKVIQAIRNLRAGLVSLETDFRTKPTLTKYLPQIQGISDLAAQSEDSAIAGKFVAAKDPLRSAAQKLTDTLAVLPK